MTQRLLSIKGKHPVSHYHKRLGKIIWEYCGMARTKEGLEKALKLIAELREEFWANVLVPGSADTLNQSLEQAGRVADFIELGELMCLDALEARGKLRRSLPRGAPVSRRRMQARRREVRPRGRLGIPGRGQDAAPERRGAELRVREMSVRNSK
jgi:succinate dehydrogenase/fumarate reductase flavoprotein subunit